MNLWVCWDSQGGFDYSNIDTKGTLLQKDIAKNKITQEAADEIKARIELTKDLESFSNVDFVIEAAPVRFPVQREA